MEDTIAGLTTPGHTERIFILCLMINLLGILGSLPARHLQLSEIVPRINSCGGPSSVGVQFCGTELTEEEAWRSVAAVTQEGPSEESNVWKYTCFAYG